MILSLLLAVMPACASQVAGFKPVARNLAAPLAVAVTRSVDRHATLKALNARGGEGRLAPLAEALAAQGSLEAFLAADDAGRAALLEKAAREADALVSARAANLAAAEADDAEAVSRLHAEVDSFLTLYGAYSMPEGTKGALKQKRARLWQRRSELLEAAVKAETSSWDKPVEAAPAAAGAAAAPTLAPAPAEKPVAEPAPEPAAPAVKKARTPAWKRWLSMAAAPLKILTNRASNDRDWSPDLVVLPRAEFDGDTVTIRNVRNFAYRTTKDFTPGYYDKTFKKSDVESIWFGVEPFGDWRGPAHTFVSFGFKDGTYLAVSVEIRRTKGEVFSAWKGLWNYYELTYVIADERDVVKLRTNHRKSDVHLYKIDHKMADSPARLLVDMLARANELEKKPQFYNSLWNTCTTNILKHFNAVAPFKLGWSREILFPVHSDELAYRHGLIDRSLPLEQRRAAALISPKALAAGESSDFSKKIRE